MDDPEQQQPTPAATHLHAAIRTLLQKAGLRRILLLVLFGVLILTTTARTPAGPRPIPGVSLADHRPVPATDGGLSRIPGQPPETVALDNLLSRFDQLIRMLEAQAPEDNDESARTLAELRSLRASVFEASRRAIATTVPRPAANR